jgi:hypothetical protein
MLRMCKTNTCMIILIVILNALLALMSTEILLSGTSSTSATERMRKCKISHWKKVFIFIKLFSSAFGLNVFITKLGASSLSNGVACRRCKVKSQNERFDDFYYSSRFPIYPSPFFFYGASDSF